MIKQPTVLDAGVRVNGEIHIAKLTVPGPGTWGEYVTLCGLRGEAYATSPRDATCQACAGGAS